MIIVCLVEEYVLPIARINPHCMILECTILCDSMVFTQELPELRSDLVAALTCLDGDEFAGHDREVGRSEDGETRVGWAREAQSWGIRWPTDAGSAFVSLLRAVAVVKRQD